MAARNVLRIEINIHEKELCVKLVIYKDEKHLVPSLRHWKVFRTCLKILKTLYALKLMSAFP